MKKPTTETTRQYCEQCKAETTHKRTTTKPKPSRLDIYTTCQRCKAQTHDFVELVGIE